jgi:uncharacterized membrane protein YdjX (TVP38/TMEM64 family)
MQTAVQVASLIGLIGVVAGVISAYISVRMYLAQRRREARLEKERNAERLKQIS